MNRFYKVLLLLGDLPLMRQPVCTKVPLLLTSK